MIRQSFKALQILNAVNTAEWRIIMSNGNYYGIDLGTTNSVVSFAVVTGDFENVTSNALELDRIVQSGRGFDGKIRFNRSRSKTLPSFVYYYDNDVIVGDFARNEYKKYPDRIAKSIKSQMGNTATRGLAPDIPDKTPEEISARILRHIKVTAEKLQRETIHNVVITVPANYGLERYIATLKAAELAGFNVKDENGKWKPILISEPNAVLYDFAFRIQKGEVPSSVIDLSTDKNVVVVDMGGGTLDVTFHKLSKNTEKKDTLTISEIATSRLTQLGGDDFDAKCADYLYDRCVEMFKKHEPTALPLIKVREGIIKKGLIMEAEQMKIFMNEQVDMELKGRSFSWANYDMGDDEEEIVYEISRPIIDDRMYNDTVTKSEFEAMVESFLGKEYSFDDYKGYTANKRIRRDTVIAPILDVLEKADRYFKSIGETMSVDAVVLNGGMSKLYLIVDRLKDFFGIEPITAANPDLSVANGAAIYAALMDYRGINGIDINRHVQKEDLYLGLSAGANDLLIKTGVELPFTKDISGYRLLPGTQRVEIPIKRGEDDNELITIARSIMSFRREYPFETDLKLQVNMDQTGLLTIKAYLFRKDGVFLEEGGVELALGAPMNRVHGGGRIVPANGTKLVPANEISSLENLYCRRPPAKNKGALIKSRVDTIVNCGNPKDFEDVIMRYLGESRSISDNNYVNFRQKLYEIAGTLAPSWGEAGIDRLKEVARKDIITGDIGIAVSANRVKLSELVKSVLDNIDSAV